MAGQVLPDRDLPNNHRGRLLHGSHKLFIYFIFGMLEVEAGNKLALLATEDWKFHLYQLHLRPKLPQEPKVGCHHFLHKVTTSGVSTSQGKGLIECLSMRCNLFIRSHLRQRFHFGHYGGKGIMSNLLPVFMGRSNTKGLDVKSIAHPILVPPVLLTIRDL